MSQTLTLIHHADVNIRLRRDNKKSFVLSLRSQFVPPHAIGMPAKYFSEYKGQNHNTRNCTYRVTDIYGLGVACWPLVPKFAGSNPAEAVGFLRAKKSSARLPSEGK